MTSLVERARTKYHEDGLKSFLRSSASFIHSQSKLYIDLLKNKLLAEEYKYRGVQIDFESLDPVVQRSIANGRYEAGAIKNIDRYLRPDLDVIELGGGIGIISCYVNDFLSSDSAQVVLEPDPRVVEELKRNSTENQADIEIIETAYSPDGNSVSLTLDGPFWESSTIEDGARNVTVSGINIEEIIDRFDISDFILITNTEGAEYPLVHNEIEILKKQCEIMMVGFHNVDGYSMDEAISEIERNGFESVGSRGNKKYVFKKAPQD